MRKYGTCKRECNLIACPSGGCKRSILNMLPLFRLLRGVVRHNVLVSCSVEFVGARSIVPVTERLVYPATNIQCLHPLY